MIDEDSNSLSDSLRFEAQALITELKKLEKCLVEAEANSQGSNNNEQVRARFAKVRRMVYDAEDVVDRFVSETESSAYGRLTYLPRSIRDSKKLHKSRDQIAGMMDTMYNESLRYGGHDHITENNGSPKTGNQLVVKQANHHLDDEIVVGIEADVNKLVGILVERQDFNVLTIVGMGGSGKSTVARKLYNHKKVMKHFKHRAWISLPKEWGPSHEEHLLSELLIKMGKSGKKTPTHYLKQEPITMVQNLLEKEKCLVVFDGVWDWELEMVHKLLDIPDSGVLKSKLVITSRQFFPSPNTGWIFHETKLLSNDDSLTLFNKVSSSSNGREFGRKYPGSTKEILTKCGGLPLAIVVIGRLLEKRNTINEWEKGSYIYEPVTDILALSYYELPNHLKPFFLYLGLLMEEYITASTLKRMWIAEGFVKSQQREGETPEKAATRLLHELVNHAMVQPVTYNYTRKVKTIRVHNLMRDVSVMIAQELDFLSHVSDHPHARRAVTDLRYVGLYSNYLS
ncbi:putative disease resistance protein RXW24L [Bienertia sinuspersici]